MEEKKYIKADELKQKISELHAEPCTDEFMRMPSPIHTITAKIVEEQDEMLRKVVHHIAGNVYEEITVDKNKVFDALSKATAKKPIIDTHSLEGRVVLTCPVCGRWLYIIGLGRQFKFKYCSNCGQKFDWSDFEEDTDDEQN